MSDSDFKENMTEVEQAYWEGKADGWKEARAEIARLQQQIEAQKKALDAVSGLINESCGVSGLHLNGDIAPWGDLLEGGAYEEWLIDFSAATDLIPGDS